MESSIIVNFKLHYKQTFNLKFKINHGYHKSYITT